MPQDPPPLLPDGEFVELLARVRAGDESAAGELVRRYEPTVLRSVRSRLGKPMRHALDSIDVLQSVHRSLIVGIRDERYHVTTPQQLLGLAVVMVQRKVARQWRKIKRFATEPLNESAGEVASSSRSPIRSASPSDQVDAEEYLARILAGVDEFDRRLIQLKLDGYSTAESAEILARDPAFIRMRWARLRQRLRDRGYDHA